MRGNLRDGGALAITPGRASCKRTLPSVVGLLTAVGFSIADAAPISIDTFEDGFHSAKPANEIAASSAIGGMRHLSAQFEVSGRVEEEDGKGLLFSENQNDPGGSLTITYGFSAPLGMVDLTDGGSNTHFELNIVFRSVGVILENLTIEVTDSSAAASSVNVTWASLPASGSGLIPFSALTGTADLTSIDKIRITIQHLEAPNNITFDSIRVVSDSSPPETPTIEIVRTGPDEITISWTPTNAVLKESTTLEEGGWVDAPEGATNPAVITLSGQPARKFYRAEIP